MTEKTMKIRRSLSRNVLLAAFYGGMAEVVWVGAYCLTTGRSGAEVARQVTATLFPAAAAGVPGVALGIAIHFALSLLLALVYVRVVWLPFARRWNEAASLAAAMAALALVWTVNFLLVLPVVNPSFVELLPYPVSLASKLLFGIALAGALRDGLRRSVEDDHRYLPPTAVA
jgi:hypothetical protein